MAQSITADPRAFFSAVKKISNFSYRRELPHLKKQNSLIQNGLQNVRKPYQCQEKPIRNRFRFYFPIAYNGKNEHRNAHFQSYPVYYEISYADFKSFTQIEIIEIPILSQELLFQNEESWQDIQERLLPGSQVQIFPNASDKFEVNKKQMLRIRKTICEEVKKETNVKDYVFFSYFSQTKETKAKDIGNHDSNCSKEHEALGIGEFHSRRHIPIKLLTQKHLKNVNSKGRSFSITNSKEFSTTFIPIECYLVN